VRGRFVTSERYRVLCGSYAAPDRAESDAVARAKLLVLDEAGAEKGDVSADILRLLNRRQAGQLTIITSNLDEAAFRAWLDERALSRLMQLGHIWTVTGNDMRLSEVP
jgi:DNA replication protein DnaC